MGTGQTAREEMLATIKRALRRDAAHDLPHPDLKPEAASRQQLKAVADAINQRNAAGRDALVNQFGGELARLGAQLTIAESTVAAGAAVEGLARARQAKTVVSWRAPLVDALGLKTRLEGANIRFVADDGAGGGDGFVAHAIGAEVG